MKAWITKSVREIEGNSSCEKFKVNDKHVEVSRTPAFMRFVWLIGGIFCIGIMTSGDGYAGLVMGIIGFLIIGLINRFLTTDISKDLHVICFIDRNKKQDEYIAIDINTNELLHVLNIFEDPDDENPMEYYGFEPFSLENFKGYLKSHSERLYESIEHLTPETVSELKKIQFGEVEWSWVNFVKMREGDTVELACFKVGVSGKVDAKYALLNNETYNKHFGVYEKIYDEYVAFYNEEHAIFKDENVKWFSKELSPDEFKAIFNGDKNKSDTQIERYFCKDYVNEFVECGDANAMDINAFNFLRELNA